MPAARGVVALALTLRHLARALGFDADATFANVTSGGLEANPSAVVVALARRFPAHARLGTRAIEATPAST